jgi:hypothetical protein
LREGPLTVTVGVEGSTLPPGTVREGEFQLGFKLPDGVVGQREVHVTVEVSRTARPSGDTRELGLAFGSFEVR